MVEISLLSLLVVLVVMLFTLLCLFLYLLTNKIAKNQSRKQIDLYKDEYRLDMFHFLQNGTGTSFEFGNGDERFVAWTELMQEYSNVLASEDVKARMKQFAEVYLTDFIVKELTKKRWSLRMNALYVIEEFEMDHLSSQLHTLYQNKKVTVVERSQLLKLFALFHDEKVVDYIINKAEDLSDFALIDILSKMDEEEFDKLIDVFDELSDRLKLIVVEVIGRKQFIRHHSFLHNLINAKGQEMELTIRSLKAIINIGVPIDTSLIDKLFDSNYWQLRMMTTKLVGVHRLELFKVRLVPLLSDQEYAVRNEAAKAIFNYKDGAEVLKKITEESEDLFAKDMATEWLEKGRTND
ncbi:hypothetical protein [Aquibacillus kalidii]|uniref:hypothetical protein n=1 Tax=Aquibacillus kalidii TaxID=2762597 RepID=UPI001646DFBB|nr:hypothetical protein [Aquibacillus kalidii]